MSQPAPKRTVVPPAPPAAALADKTGRFRRASATLLPPAGASTDVVSPEEVGAELEIEAVQPERGLTSGVFGRSGDGAKLADEELAAFADSLVPYYRDGELRNERAQLEVEDLSLRLDNPYAASSLVPPVHAAKREIPWRVLIVAGIGAAAVAGAFALGLSRGAERDDVRATRLAPKAAPAVIAAAPPAAAPSRAEQPTEAVSAAPAKPAPAAIVPAPAAQPVERQPAAPSAPKVDRGPAPNSAAPAIEAEPAARSTVAAAPAAEAAPTETAAAAAMTTTPATEDETTQEAEAVALPELPTRAEVSAGFDAVRGALQTCAAGKHGIVDIDATIAGSGRVTYALIAGVFRGSPEGSCMARAVRAARFPQFSRANLKVSYPIAL